MEKGKKKSKKQRKLLLAILMLLLTGGVLASTSYAWFTANKIVTVSTLNVNVAATNGLQISVDGLDWKAIVTNEDILKTIGSDSSYSTNKNQLPINAGDVDGKYLSPVSTVGEVDENGLMKMFLGSLDTDESGTTYELTAVADPEAQGTEGHYVAFDLFFQVQERTQIYLTHNSNVTGDATADKGIQNAARVAFINEGAVDINSSKDAIQGKITANASSIIWEPNADVHTSTGKTNAETAYGLTTQLTGAAPLAYVGVKAPIIEPVAVNSKDEAYFSPVTPTLQTNQTGIDENNYKEIFILEAGITKMRIYMWIEGQDVDCESWASGGKLDFNLQFSSNKDSAGTPGEITEP